MKYCYIFQDHIKYGLHAALLIEPYQDPKQLVKYGPLMSEFLQEWTISRNASMRIAKIVKVTGRKMLCTAMDITIRTEREKISKVVAVLSRKQAKIGLEMERMKNAKVSCNKKRFGDVTATRTLG
jgi:hypothetical protein